MRVVVLCHGGFAVSCCGVLKSASGLIHQLMEEAVQWFPALHCTFRNLEHASITSWQLPLSFLMALLLFCQLADPPAGRHIRSSRGFWAPGLPSTRRSL